MKSRLTNTASAISTRLPRRFSRFPRISQTGLALAGAVCMLTLSGCYYPYGYYPAATTLITPRSRQARHNRTCRSGHPMRNRRSSSLQRSRRKTPSRARRPRMRLPPRPPSIWRRLIPPTIRRRCIPLTTGIPAGMGRRSPSASVSAAIGVAAMVDGVDMAGGVVAMATITESRSRIALTGFERPVPVLSRHGTGPCRITRASRLVPTPARPPSMDLAAPNWPHAPRGASNTARSPQRFAVALSPQPVVSLLDA